MSTEHSILTGPGMRSAAGFVAPASGAVVSRVVAGLLTGLLLSAAVVLLVRRLAGALAHPLPAGVLCFVAVLATLAAIVAQRQSPGLARSRFADELAWWLPAAALVPLALALSLPGTSWAGLVWLWILPIAGETALGYRRFVARGRLHGRRPAPPGSWPLPPHTEPSGTREPYPLEPAADPQINQHFTRRCTAEGVDLIEGWLRAPLAVGQRTTQAHVSFCPPFASTPELDFEQADGPTARVRLGQLLAYGVRFEVKLEAMGPAEVLIAFSARSRSNA